VRDFVLSTTGNFLSTDVYKSLGLSTRNDQKNISIILKRLCEQGVIEKHGDKNGHWRLVQNQYIEQEWWKSSGQALNVRFPLGVERFAKVYHGNVILLEGQKSQGKSAFAIDFCRLNAKLFPDRILYQNVEMSDDEIKKRVDAYEADVVVEFWQFISIKK